VLDVLKSQVDFKLRVLVREALIVSKAHFRDRRGSCYYKVPKKSFKHVIYNTRRFYNKSNRKSTYKLILSA
jgi:hypothetical protein